MNRFFKSAQTARHVLIDLYDHNICHITNRLQMRCIRSEIEISESIHRCHLKHRYIQMSDIFSIILRQLRKAHRAVKSKSIIDGPPFYPAHMPGVPCKMVCRIFHFKDFRSPQQDTASNLYVFQFICPCCQRCIQRYRSPCCPGIIDPVSGFYYLDCFISSHQLLIILCLIIHLKSPSTLLLYLSSCIILSPHCSRVNAKLDKNGTATRRLQHCPPCIFQHLCLPYAKSPETEAFRHLLREIFFSL